MHFKKYLYTCVFLSSIANAYALDSMPEKVSDPIHIKKMPPTFSGEPNGLSPEKVKLAYGLNKVKNQGLGQIIAIVNPFDDPYAEYDLGIFSSTFSLPACNTANGCFKKIYADGIQPLPNAGWASETALDIEWAHAIAPEAKIFLVEAKSDNPEDLYSAIQVAVANGANVISLSWGAPEGNWVKIFDMDKYLKAPNVTFVAASGDSGTGVNFPASSPYVISVGGTTLNLNADGKRASETAWSGSSGGISTVELAPDEQKSYPLPNNPQQYRGVPDVSFNADPNTGYSVYNSMKNAQGQTGWFVVGGTSAGAPQWAAMVAIANSIANKSISVKPLLYAIAKKNYKMSYVDIRSGKNGGCGNNCETKINYDYVTGLGSPHTKYLINNLVKLSGVVV